MGTELSPCRQAGTRLCRPPNRTVLSPGPVQGQNATGAFLQPLLKVAWICAAPTGGISSQSVGSRRPICTHTSSTALWGRVPGAGVRANIYHFLCYFLN